MARDCITFNDDAHVLLSLRLLAVKHPLPLNVMFGIRDILNSTHTLWVGGTPFPTGVHNLKRPSVCREHNWGAVYKILFLKCSRQTIFSSVLSTISSLKSTLSFFTSTIRGRDYMAVRNNLSTMKELVTVAAKQRSGKCR